MLKFVARELSMLLLLVGAWYFFQWNRHLLFLNLFNRFEIYHLRRFDYHYLNIGQTYYIILTINWRCIFVFHLFYQLVVNNLILLLLKLLLLPEPFLIISFKYFLLFHLVLNLRLFLLIVRKAVGFFRV